MVYLCTASAQSRYWVFSSKYVFLMGLGLLGSLMLFWPFLSQIWTTALMGLVWDLVAPISYHLLIRNVAGTPGRISEFY